MSPCLTSQQLSDLLDDKLDDEQLAQCVAHIETCPSCRLELAHLSTQDKLAVTPPLHVAISASDPDPAFLHRLKQQPPSRMTWHDRDAEPADMTLPDLLDFEILEELGRGGMGVVYRAKQRSLKRIVALKFQNVHQLVGPESRQRFQREAEAVARLQHPHIVEIYEIGEHDGAAYLALEYLPNSLAQRLDGPLLSVREASALVETLSRAMAHAHKGGVVHRDLKPANVLLTGDGTPKITDFGLAKQVAEEAKPQAATIRDKNERKDVTQTGQILGTPSYMAPEQAQGKKDVGPAADLYALGVILYELLTGRPPFQGESSLDVLQQVLGQEPVPPSRLRSKLPRDVEVICLKCLEKEPAHRYADCAALADDLRRFQNGEPIAAKPTPLWRRAVKWAQRRPTLAALIMVSTLAAITLLASWVNFTSHLQHLTVQLQAKSKHALNMADLAIKEKQEADRQKNLAVASLKEARKTGLENLFLVRDDVDLLKAGLEPLRRKLLDKAIKLNDKLLAYHGDVPDLQLDRAEGYHVMGNLLFRVSTMAHAKEYFQKAVDVSTQLVRKQPNNPHYRRSLGNILLGYSRTLQQKGQLSEAEQAIRQSLEHLAWLAARARPEDGNPHFYVGAAYTHLGRALRRQENLDGAEQAYRAAETAITEALRRKEIADYFYYLSTIYHNRHVIHNKRHDTEQAETYALRAVLLREQLVCRSPGYPIYLEGYANSLQNLAVFYQQYDRPLDAEQRFGQALTVWSFLVWHHPKVRRWRLKHAGCHQAVGNLYQRTDRSEAAARAYCQGCDILYQGIRASPQDWEFVSRYASCLLLAAASAQKEQTQAVRDEFTRGRPVVEAWVSHRPEAKALLKKLAKFDRAMAKNDRD